jgi:hypothetical protein
MTKLKTCDPEVKLYIKQLEKINLKLHDKIAKLQAQNVDYQHEITALKRAQPKFIVQPISYVDAGKKNKNNKD